MKQFCEWQMKTKESGKKFDCTAHLCEGHIFLCPYTSIADAKNQEYPCVDAEAPKRAA